MKTYVPPYLTPSGDRWDLADWDLIMEGARSPLPDRLDDWDFARDLSVASVVTVHAAAILEDCRLGPDANVVLAAFWEASTTGIRQMAYQAAVNTDHETLEVILEVPGALLGGTLTLERQVVLIQPGDNSDTLAPSLPGSILLREPPEARSRVQLEGMGARFPTEFADFTGFPIAEPEAVWYLDVSMEELEASTLSGIRLFLNSVHPAAQAAIRVNDPLGEHVRSLINWDVGRTLIDRALDSLEFLDSLGTFPEGSLGETLEQLLARCWPGEAPATIKRRRESDLGQFERTLQARLRLFAEV